MLSDDLRHLCEQVKFFRDRDMIASIQDVVVERLDALADRAAALEATVVPDAARVNLADYFGVANTVISFEMARDARRRAGR